MTNTHTKTIHEMALFPIDDGGALIYVNFETLKAYVEEGIAQENEILIFEEVKDIFQVNTIPSHFLYA